MATDPYTNQLQPPLLAANASRKTTGVTSPRAKRPSGITSSLNNRAAPKAAEGARPSKRRDAIDSMAKAEKNTVGSDSVVKSTTKKEADEDLPPKIAPKRKRKVGADDLVPNSGGWETKSSKDQGAVDLDQIGTAGALKPDTKSRTKTKASSVAKGAKAEFMTEAVAVNKKGTKTEPSFVTVTDLPATIGGLRYVCAFATFGCRLKF